MLFQGVSRETPWNRYFRDRRRKLFSSNGFFVCYTIVYNFILYYWT